VAIPSIDLEDLTARERVLAAELLRRSFRDFAELFWPRLTNLPYPDNPATRALCAAFQAVADKRIRRLLVAISPGIGKSTMLALYAAWRRSRRHDWRSIHSMAASGDANRESARVRRLVTSAEFLWLFPAFAVREIEDEPEIFRPALELAEDEQTVQSWATSEGGRYYALGRDSTVTSKRVLEVVVDDPMTAADRRSKAARDEVYTHLDESLMSRVDGDGPIMVIAQRLDRDDIHARCLASGQDWCLLEPAAERDDRGLELRDHAGEIVWQDDRAPGELIAPQMLTHAKLAGFSKSVRTVQYQQRPDEDSGGGTIARTSWGFHAPAGANPNAARPDGCAKPADSPTVVTPDRFDSIVISCDPTFGGTKTENDFCSIQVWGRASIILNGVNATGYFLLARWHERAKQLAQQNQLKAFRELFPDAAIRIENTAGGPGMKENLDAEGIADVEIEGTGGLGKAARLDNESVVIDQGFAFLPIGMPDLQYFVNELAGMTNHDDDMDACSQAIRWLKVKRPPRLPSPVGGRRGVV
jgi:phage terminase large subunit-like protein